ncbi:heavy metal translocating P-type ATPase [Magnetospirillum fulvum]|uniref:Cu2+-exporting ATPase n=1 Tax=Magnetospirillum fulvum TaxID=1082 RepID=A0A1H6HXA7_MAGFU|nr:heavy metal translocating P-type ATPase [Magnetospirillum fulvum]SEH40858.1 Cu2+-exporting ATPase [Magnetospirillum fulvum]
MIVGLGLLCLAYYGAKKLPEDSPIAIKIREVSETAIRYLTDEKPPPENLEDDKEAEKKYVPEPAEVIQGHYTNASAFCLGALAVRRFVPLAGPIGFAAYVYGMGPHLRDVEASLLKEKKIDCDSLFLFADVLALVTGNYVAAALSLYMIHLGKLGVLRAKDLSRKELRHLFLDLPGKVWVIRDGCEIEVDLESVQKDECIVLHGGNVIPVDGVIVQGIAGINQQALTGEAQIVEKGPGESVFANTFVSCGRILVKAERSGSETTSNQIADILLNSISYKSDAQLKGEKWADQLTMPLFYSSLGLLPIIGPVSTSVFINSHIGMRIRVFAPMVTLKHISMASKNGLLVKDGRALERLIEVDAILFDKTGTLTHEDQDVTRIHCVNGCDEAELIRYAAIAEQKQTHPIAQAILRKAREMEVSFPDIEDSNYSIGYGITVVCGDEIIQVGSVRYLEGEAIPLPDDLRQLQIREQTAGHTFVFLAVDGQVRGAVQLEAQIRAEVEQVVAGLRQQGIGYMAIVSGDHDGPTRALAERLGMDAYFANVLPQQKAEIVTRLQDEGKVVCFVGDGINDSIALKQADVSISVAGASTIAKDMAEIVLMDGHLHEMNLLHDISSSLDRNLNKSLWFCIAPGVVNLFGTFVVKFTTLTSLLVNTSFAGIGMAAVSSTPDVVREPAPEPEDAEAESGR